jgi:hypothetical protein
VLGAELKNHAIVPAFMAPVLSLLRELAGERSQRRVRFF